MILFARHGETTYNVAPARVMGRRDIPLNSRGRSQSRELAKAVAGDRLAAIWTSDLRRARQTAQIVAEPLGLKPHVDARLAESDRGTWEGRLMDDIRIDDPELWAAWERADSGFRFPAGESLAEHLARVSAALEAVAAGPLPALVIAHGGTIRCAAAARHARGLEAFHELDVPNAAVIRLEPADGVPES